MTVTPHIVRAGESGGIGATKLGIPRPAGSSDATAGYAAAAPATYKPASPDTAPDDASAAAPEPQPVIVPTPRFLRRIHLRPAESPRAKPSRARYRANTRPAADGVFANQCLHVWSGSAKQLRGNQRGTADLLRSSVAVGREKRSANDHRSDHDDQRRAAHLWPQLALADGIAAKYRPRTVARNVPLLGGRVTDRQAAVTLTLTATTAMGSYRCSYPFPFPR